MVPMGCTIRIVLVFVGRRTGCQSYRDRNSPSLGFSNNQVKPVLLHLYSTFVRVEQQVR